MKNGQKIIIVIMTVFVGLVIVYLLRNQNQITNITEESAVTNTNNNQTATIIQIQPTKVKPPTPTFAPVGTVVISKNDTEIVVENKAVKNSTFNISKSAKGVKYFIKKGSNLIPASYDDVKVGQNVTLKIIKTGVEAHFIIES